MNKKHIFSILIFFMMYPHISSSQGVWSFQNPYPQNNDLNAVQFLNQNTGFAVGGAGTIIKTTNGGINWQNLRTGSTAELSGLNVLDNNNIYASGENNFLKSTNGGADWMVVTVVNTLHLDHICFVNTNTGYGMDFARILKSTDSGINWFTVYTASLTVIYCFDFIDSNIGFVSDNGTNNSVLRRTSNGGANWQTVFATSGNDIVSSVLFLNALTGYAGRTNGAFTKTTDAGLTWATISTVPGIGIYLISALDENNILIGNNYSNHLMKSSDGGINWTYFPFGTISSVTGISNPAPGIVYTVSAFSDINKTTNGGTNWDTQNKGYFEDMQSIFFVNPQIGYTCGSLGRFLKTTNSGTTWDTIGTGFTNNFYSVCFLNNNTGFLSGSNGLILRTTNSGINWISVFSAPTAAVTGMVFTDQMTGFAANSSSLLYTSNSGLNWVVKPFPGNPSPMKISFVNSNTGLVLTGVGNLYKTTNSGDNWNTILTNSSMWTIFFVNANTGYGGANGFYKTTDGGNTWNILPTGIPYGIAVTQISFINESTGFISGLAMPHSRSMTMVCKTTDGCATWTNEFAGTIDAPNSLFAINSEVCYVAGNYGAILKRTDGSLLGTNNNGDELPIRYKLFQNYPNPFNPKTAINYELPNADNVRLSVFDLLGREVAVLVNEHQNRGSYKVEWDGTNYSSGLYFCRLTAGDYSQTNKMVLIK